MRRTGACPGKARDSENERHCSRKPVWWILTCGFFALVWFLLRVLPRPSRAAYPCQRVAGPAAAAFVSYVTGALTAGLLVRKARRQFGSSRPWIAAACLAAAAGAVYVSFNLFPGPTRADFVPEAPNAPVGAAAGLFPGRVAWIHNPESTLWDGTNGYWWDNANTDQAQVDAMLARALELYTEEASPAAAWDALFRSFNRAHGKGDLGYQNGETIAVKINLNNSGAYNALDNQTDTSPQVTRALLRQFVNVVGVPQGAITVYDASRVLHDIIYTGCQPEFPAVRYADTTGQQGRVVVGWSSETVHYADTGIQPQRLPLCTVDADYFINAAALKMHSIAGVTLIGKNLCGSIEGGPSRLHTTMDCRSRGMAAYNPIVDLMGHKDHGGKTLIYLIDGLYSSPSPGGNPRRWASVPFGNRWPASLLVSQDGVAVDSVCVDLWASETALFDFCDNYLHEAAQADAPPSSTSYDPEGDGTRLASLGAHEHWNDDGLKQYTRNLGTGDGIELLWERMTSGAVPDVRTTMTLAHPIPLREGDTVTFSILIENVSPGTADTNVRFTHRLSPGTSGFAMVTPPLPGTWAWDPVAVPNGEVAYDLARIDPGQAVRFEYSVTVDHTCGPQPYRLCNVATTATDWNRANEPAPRSADSGNGLPPEPSCTPDILPEGHLLAAVTKAVTTAEPSGPGDPVTYEITLTNDGPCAVTGAIFEDDVPSGLRNFDPVNGVAANPPGPANVSTGPGTGANGAGFVRVEGIDLAAGGGSAVITFTAELADIPPCTAVCNTGRYLIPQAGGFSPTNTVCQDVSPAWSLTVVKTFQAPGTPVRQGDTVTYEIAVTNDSPACAVAGAELRDAIPAGVGFDLAAADIRIVDDPGGSARDDSLGPPAGAHGNGLLRITGIDLPAGGSTFRVTFEVSAATVSGPPGICNEASVVAGGSTFTSGTACYEVEAARLPGPIAGLMLRRAGSDVVLEAWQADPDAVSYSVYMVTADPPDKARIADANAGGVALYPGSIQRVCGEVPAPPPPCVHAGGVAASPPCIFYQVVGVAANGAEGPN